jgi:iron complex outermembrane recepter protein
MCSVRRQRAALGCALFLLLLAPAAAAAQSLLRTTLPPVTVTAQKASEDPKDVPVSVSAVSAETLEDAAIVAVSGAAIYAPNTYFNEFTARKLSNARFRGIGAGPNNSGVTTYIDGVPQLNANSSSLELVGIEQIDFVRGPLSALWGRNTLGGVINITSTRPSFQKWSGDFSAPFGNFGSADMRGTASGPLAGGKLALGVSAGYARRDGFTVNDVTGNDIDSRSAGFGKAQLLWRPAENWEARAMLTLERARDGDYGLQDVGALRANPFHSRRNVEGFTHRDIVAPTFHVTHSGSRIDFSAVTGILRWKTNDFTDLDYTELPLATRSNIEEDLQFTEELRFASAKNAAIKLSSRFALRWQAGLFLFTQNYDQTAVNAYSPFVLSPLVPIPVAQTSPQAALDDVGLGIYGQGTFTYNGKLDLVVGARGDRENRDADLNTFFTPAIGPPQVVNASKTFSDVSPQFAVAYRAVPTATVYGTATRGFKAGGFNAASPVGSEAYGQEHSWNYEGGVKSTTLGGRLSANLSVFRIDWDDLQVFVPNPQVPTQFFISNAAGAVNSGVEVEVGARPAQGVEVFGGLGITNARFSDGSFSNGIDVSGNKLSNAPGHTADVGVQYSRPIWHATALTVRGEIVRYGEFQYDDANTLAQEAYSIANFRGGLRGRRLFGEAWIRNAFDTHYIPIAFPQPGLAPSGFLGENGAPRTFGVRVGATF